MRIIRIRALLLSYLSDMQVHRKDHKWTSKYWPIEIFCAKKLCDLIHDSFLKAACTIWMFQIMKSTRVSYKESDQKKQKPKKPWRIFDCEVIEHIGRHHMAPEWCSLVTATIHVLSRVHWMEEVRLKNSFGNCTHEPFMGIFSHIKTLHSVPTPILEGKIKNIGIDKRWFWTENKIYVNLEQVFAVFWELHWKYIYIT